ncbi:hypothetical protein POJ06DRAFT_79547 [Lipomyces tetrasporus]|uniref:Uncharacterized protein n=1 Tax=Lipomyces tetrasporus TaxID=54092 RepID=A0AAD7QWJ6_9ASCO|nr:uncharacterized protein POJ06DRAFT_79547 [Lipomyces tetrasporus]KAJ8102216.1 hypothetical protein POJ06DRAFT_79547 [Lipomyces tetrasporus]
MSDQPFTEISPDDAPHPPSSRLERELLQLFINLHATHPNHEIFGQPAKSRPTDQSWAMACKRIAFWVSDEMKSDFTLNGCWMSRTSSFGSLRGLTAII